MSEPFIGEIRIFSFGFAPKGWALCNGQLLPINQNTALFSLLGTYYGGNGTNNFALPNLQGRMALHQGQGTGLSPYQIGQTGGTTAITISSSTLPSHSHTLSASSAAATAPAIGSTLVPATPTSSNATAYVVSQASAPSLVPQAMSAGVVATAGGSQPHSNVMPSLCLNFCIALTGIFPSRN